MGCNVSPYRGGVLKYKETVTATVDSITTGETKTFFTASKNCIVKVKSLTSASNCQLYINDTVAASLQGVGGDPKFFTNLADREELFFSRARAGSNNVEYEFLLLLLKPGDELQFHCGAGTYTNVQHKIYVYEWE